MNSSSASEYGWRRHVFTAAPSGLVRMAALPNSRAALASTPDKVSTDPDNSDYTANLTEHLTRIAADAVVREAIEVSSDSLARTIDKMERGEHVKRSKLIRAAHSATRYVLRMSGRATPFGLLAGVEHVEFGESTGIRVGSAHRKYARADAEWLDAVLREHRADDELRAASWVVANNLGTVRENRLVLPYVRARNRESIDELSSELTVGYTSVVRLALQAARKPIRLPDLHRELSDAYPQSGDSAIDGLLSQLIEHELLLTDFDARQDQPDQLRYVTRRLPANAQSTGEKLVQIASLVDDYAASAPGEGRHAWRRAVTAMRELHPFDRSPIHVDTRVDADMRLPQAVADEAARAADALWRVGPETKLSLRDYHNWFLDRYGTDELVPISELLDPHRGLGAPAGYRIPPSEKPASAVARESFPADRDHVLAEAIQRNAASGEIELDDALLDQLAHQKKQPPESLDICVQPLARCASAIDQGQFQLVVMSLGHSAGSLSGRFRHMLDTADGPRDTQLTTDSAAGPLRAQLYFQPLHARPSNVSRVPRFAPHALALGCFPDGEDALGPEDIGVGATLDGLYLAHLTTGRQVLIDRPHLLNLITEAPNMARLLAAVSSDLAQECVPWNWGRLDALAYLPRVRYGRSILATARWRTAASLNDPSLSFHEWQDELQRWRQQWGVPERTKVQNKDYYLDLDLSDPLHQDLLRAKLVGGDPTLLHESPTGEADLVFSNGHVTEVVVPLHATEPCLPTVKAKPREGSRIAHAPGGDWIYAKIYAVRARHEMLLSRDIAELVGTLSARIDRWYFVRYADPESHVRIRLHANNEQERTTILAQLHTWAQQAIDDGVIRKLALDTYEPEQTRYGGPEALSVAERLFSADSALVVQQLRMRARDQLDGSAELLAAVNCADLLAELGDWNWRQWVVDTFPITAQHELSAAERRRAVGLLDPSDRWRALSASPAADQVAPLWIERARVAREYGSALGIEQAGERFSGDQGQLPSILHMHVNRLLGPGRKAERRVYALLRTAVSAQLVREQNMAGTDE